MSEDRDDALDRLLAREFSRAFEPRADDGFTEAVVRRLRRRESLRGLTLGLAAAAGLGIAFVPLLDMAGALADFLPLIADDWRAEEMPGQYRYLAIAVLLGLASPLLIRFLER